MIQATELLQDDLFSPLCTLAEQNRIAAVQELRIADCNAGIFRSWNPWRFVGAG